MTKQYAAVQELLQLSNKIFKATGGLNDAADKCLDGKIAEAKNAGNSAADQLEALAREVRDLVKAL